MNTVAVARPKFFIRADVRKRIPNRKLRPADVKQAIQHAQLICYNFEETPACRVAWDQVEEISKALARQQERDLVEKALEEMRNEEDWEAQSTKEFDV
jgi:CP12 domain